MYDVVALGELLIDFTTQSVDANGYPIMASHPGGAPANFLATIVKFGGKAALLGKVGTDAFGKLLIRTLCEIGIETKGLVPTDDFFTTLAFITLDRKGNREFSFARKPGADSQIRFDELDLSIIDNSSVFHFGSFSLISEPARTATYDAVDYAKAHGKLISYDPNLRKPLWCDLAEAKKQILWGLTQADIVKISNEEVKFLYDLDAQQGAEYILKNFPVKLIFVTCGEDGCWFQNRNASGHVDGLKNIKVVDTTGAGDIFGGSALWKVLEAGKVPESLNEVELREIVSFACETAGLSTTKYGGISSIR